MMAFAEAAGSRWAALIWPLLWQGTVVGLIALVLLPILRRLSPAIGLALIGIALLKLFVPPVVLAPMAVIDQAAFLLRPDAPLADARVLAVALMGAHVAGFAVVLLRLVARCRELSRLVAQGTPIPPDAGEVVRALALDLGMKRPPEVLESPVVAAPIALGVRRPIVLLPAGLRSTLSRDDFRIVLAHEMVHHRQHDLLAEALVSTACAVWWFHPLSWALASLFRELREERCDDRVIGLGVDRYAYCRTLLDVAAIKRPSPAAAMRSTHPLGRRFHRVLHARQRPRAVRVLGAAIVLLFAVVALPHTTARAAAGFDGRRFGPLDPRADLAADAVVRRVVSVRVTPPATIRR